MSEDGKPTTITPSSPVPGGTPPNKTILGQANNVLTAVGAIVGTIGTIVATLAAHLASGAKDEAQSARGKTTELKKTVEDIEARRKALDDNYAYVKLFLHEIGDQRGETEGVEEKGSSFKRTNSGEKNDTFPKDPKVPDRTLLEALSVIASANTSKEGDAPALDRATLPIIHALECKQPGSVASIDHNLVYIDKWIDYVEVSGDPEMWTTAIKAIGNVCRVAALKGDGRKLLKGVTAISDLIALDPDVMFGDRAQVNQPPSDADGKTTGLRPSDPERFQKALELRNKLADIFNYANSRNTLRLETSLSKSEYGRLLEIQKANKVEGKTAVANALAMASTGLDLVNIEAPLTAATTGRSEARKKEAELADLAARLESSPLLEPAADAAMPPAQTVGSLISDLSSPVATTRHSARQKLAGYGKTAVNPLMVELANVSHGRSDAAYKTKLGIAIALALMPQPTTLTHSQIALIVDLLRSPDLETRSATVNFLINLEDDETLRDTYVTLVSAVEPIVTKVDGTTKEEQQFVFSSITAMGGWGTALGGEVMGVYEDPTKSQSKRTGPEAYGKIGDWKILIQKTPLRDQAITKIKAWSEKLLTRTDKDQWAKTIERIGEMSNRAAAKKAAEGAAAKPIKK